MTLWAWATFRPNQWTRWTRASGLCYEATSACRASCCETLPKRTLWKNKLTAPPKCFFGILGSIPEVSRNDLNLEGASKLGTLWNKHISVLPLSLHPRPTAFLEHLVNLQEFGIRYSNVEFKSDLVSVLFVTATCWNLPETQHKHSAVQPLICLSTTGPPTQSTKGCCNVAPFWHMSCYFYSFLFRGSSWDYYVI